MNNRRRLLIVFGTAAYAPHALFGQTTSQPVLIGWLSSGTRAGYALNLAAFKEGMAAFGWKEGATYVLHERWADGQIARLPALAYEIAAYKPALIVATHVPTARAVAKVAPNMPIVLVGGDPVSARLVKSYAQPGGMITGIVTANTEISEKFLELLVTAAPNVRRVGFLISRNAANFELLQENARRSAAQYKVEARFADISRPDEIEPALSSVAKEGVQGLIMVAGSEFDHQPIVKFALNQRWPLVGGGAPGQDGALLRYGPGTAIYRRAAYFVDRIMRGAKPMDLPIERPMTFELVVNLKTAKAIGLTMPPVIMVQATRVIE